MAIANIIHISFYNMTLEKNVEYKQLSDVEWRKKRLGACTTVVKGLVHRFLPNEVSAKFSLIAAFL